MVRSIKVNILKILKLRLMSRRLGRSEKENIEVTKYGNILGEKDYKVGLVA